MSVSEILDGWFRNPDGSPNPNRINIHGFKWIRAAKGYRWDWIEKGENRDVGVEETVLLDALADLYEASR